MNLYGKIVNQAYVDLRIKIKSFKTIDFKGFLFLINYIM
ncbi:hypothetical protein BMQ_pBM70066 (plasmid) [Priestia megaterium QM B1551]|jgi:hypothetical protein|uniref:Uncharacterized protein n=1 Tax=Priestia megaterium (strain ATCC 12872 / QMB1551) TaxID=545693 RepID=D5E483_PRIM1|nr:hypothetical protein BMQ_pBM70066 [Priestia megaterium QM B1551]